VMIVVQELAENLVKYSNSESATFTARLYQSGPQWAHLELETVNAASPEDVTRAQALLDEVALRGDPDSLYQERIASSSTRTRSELGLLRIVTEAATALRLQVEGERMHLYAKTGLLRVVEIGGADSQFLAPTRSGEGLR
jgi:hypothetical protein